MKNALRSTVSLSKCNVIELESYDSIKESLCSMDLIPLIENVLHCALKPTLQKGKINC